MFRDNPIMERLFSGNPIMERLFRGNPIIESFVSIEINAAHGSFKFGPLRPKFCA